MHKYHAQSQHTKVSHKTRVCPVQRGQEAVQRIRDATGSNTALAAELEVTDQASVDAFGAWAERELGSISILINNAGAPCVRVS